MMLEYQVGEWTARLHEHGLRWGRHRGAKRPKWDWERFFGQTSILNTGRGAAVLTQDDRQVIGDIAALVRAEMQRLDCSVGSFGLIHADLHQSNYLFDGEQVGVIDFEDCGMGYHLFDVATTLPFATRSIVIPC